MIYNITLIDLLFSSKKVVKILVNGYLLSHKVSRIARCHSIVNLNVPATHIFANQPAIRNTRPFRKYPYLHTSVDIVPLLNLLAALLLVNLTDNTPYLLAVSHRTFLEVEQCVFLMIIYSWTFEYIYI